MNAINPNVIKMTPVMVEGSQRFVLLMSTWQAYDLRTTAGTTTWLQYQQAAAAAEGRNSPIFKGGLGMIGGTVLHEHQNVRRFNNYGVGSNIPAARALFLGAQAGVEAYGQGGRGTRFQWVEETTDAGNQVAIYSGLIYGFKKVNYNGFDYGVMAVDTAAKNPG
jgi:N4-gp56 family major capsid protein